MTQQEKIDLRIYLEAGMNQCILEKKTCASKAQYEMLKGRFYAFKTCLQTHAHLLHEYLLAELKHCTPNKIHHADDVDKHYFIGEKLAFEEIVALLCK